MKIVIIIWMFYKKLIIPGFSTSIVIEALPYLSTGSLSFKWLGISYMILTPMFQYYIYEIRNPDEYYFYYNMGINKLILWMSTVILSFLIGLILMLL